MKHLSVAMVILLAVVARLLYTPMPEGIEDKFGATFFFLVWNAVMVYPQMFRTWMGQGEYLDNLVAFQEYIYHEGESSPVTSYFGGLNVTRATLNGVPVIVYRHWENEGERASLRPAFIFFHGGGWISGSADTYDWTVYNYAMCSGAVAINVDYRRAPQHPFPAGFNDVIAVTRYILRHGERLGIDVTKVGVAGDSAGGNLAAATAFHLTKTDPSDLPRLRYQVLLYPVLQALTFRLPAHLDNSETFPVLYARHVASFTSIYFGLGGRNGETHGTIFSEDRHVSPDFKTKSKYAKYVDVNNLPEKYRKPAATPPQVMLPHNDTIFQRIKDLLVDPRFSPLMADDVTGLPAAMIVVQKYDVLRDDGLLYAKRLRDAGVDTAVHDGNGFHVDHLRLTPQFLFSQTGQKAVDDVCSFVKRVTQV